LQNGTKTIDSGFPISVRSVTICDMSSWRSFADDWTLQSTQQASNRLAGIIARGRTRHKRTS